MGVTNKAVGMNQMKIYIFVIHLTYWPVLLGDFNVQMSICVSAMFMSAMESFTASKI